jgi:hypothetical protein
MRIALLIAVTSLAIISSCLLYRSAAPVVEPVTVKNWEHIVDPNGVPVAYPDQVRWEVDSESCGNDTQAVVDGLFWASGRWIAATGVDIRRALDGEKINLAIYCAPFGKTYSEAPRAYRIRSLETASDATLERIAVDVPSNWLIVEKHTDAELDNVGRMFWSSRGGAYYAVGLALGLKHAYSPGKNANVAELSDVSISRRCVKNCDT